VKVEKNGPHCWMVDEQTVSFGETASFGGLEARWVARLDPAVPQAIREVSEGRSHVTPLATRGLLDTFPCPTEADKRTDLSPRQREVQHPDDALGR
jgi:hypothetical protein